MREIGARVTRDQQKIGIEFKNDLGIEGYRRVKQISPLKNVAVLMLEGIFADGNDAFRRRDGVYEIVDRPELRRDGTRRPRHLQSVSFGVADDARIVLRSCCEVRAAIIPV